MTLFDSPAFEGHEAIHAFRDPDSGLRCIIAIHSTARGPSAGGCRMWPYPDSDAALQDALQLSRAMSFKNAVADLDLGGGKAVIIGDAATQKTPRLFEAFGRAIEQLGGRYWTAEDVGVSPADLAHARRHSRHVAGLEGHPAASGDPSPVTAEGVFRGVALAVRRAYGCGLGGVGIAVQGVGQMGGALAQKLADAGARLVIADPDEARLRAVAERTGARWVQPDAIFDQDVQVFAPCAMGGAISLETLARLKARVIAGGANNQLATAEAGQAAHEKGLLYVPDFVINGGGIINVAAEISALDSGGAYDPAWVEGKLDRLMQTLAHVLQRSAEEDRPTQDIANEIARARIEEARVRRASA